MLPVFALSSEIIQGRSAASAPSLPAPGGIVVNVSTEPQLQAALQRLRSNSTIVLAPGKYSLSSTLSIAGRLSNIAIRGGTGSADDVVLIGPGMANRNAGTVPNGITVGSEIDGILIANLTIRDFPRQAILFNAGSQNPHVYNVHFVDAGEAAIRSDAETKTGGVANGIVEYSTIEYSTAAPGANTIGIDIHAGDDWILRHNLFRNIATASGQTTGAAIVAHDSSSGTIVDGNTFLNCARAVAYGLDNTPEGFDHRGGIISNNFVYRASHQHGEAAISVADSPATEVVNNTVFLSGTHSTPIEYRFSGTTGVLLANNLLDGFLWARDGATGTEQNNLVGATSEMFVDAAAGDLHLSASARTAIDHGVDIAEVTTDWDGEPRQSPQDIGADEYQAAGGGQADTLATRSATESSDLVSSAASADTTAPTVSITSPANGATISGGTVTVAATAADNVAVIGVQFRVDGNNIGSLDFSRPYTAAWNTSGVANGTHTLTAVARDAANNLRTSAPITVTVKKGGDTTAPTVSITSPANGATISGGTVTVAATAADNVAVIGVQFRVDGNNIGSLDFSRPYTAAWNTSGVANGTHTLTAVARDAANNLRTSAPVTVTVKKSGDATAPTVSISSPAGGSKVTGSAITISASATDNVRVVGVQFKVDGVNLAAEDVSTPFSTVWNTTTIANGTHTLTAVARDAAGNTRTSAAVSVTVGNTSTLPPKSVVFQKSPDHATIVTGYKLEIFANGADPNVATPVASVNLGKPTPQANGDISVNASSTFTALPVGTYKLTVSAVGGGKVARSAAVTFVR